MYIDRHIVGAGFCVEHETLYVNMRGFLLLLGAALCVLPAVRGGSEEQMTQEARLYKQLTEDYTVWNPDRVLRPLFNSSETQMVNFGLSLISFLSFDTETSIARFHTWERYLWNDSSLRWDPEDFGGISTIHIPISKIWQPDILLYNGFDPAVKLQDVLAVVSSDGTVLYIPIVYRQVLCNTDSDDADVACKFTFGSWTYDGFKLDVNLYEGLEEVDISNYVVNKEYELTAHPAVKNTKYYPCCAEPYPDVAFTLEFKKTSTGGWWGKK